MNARKERRRGEVFCEKGNEWDERVEENQNVCARQPWGEWLLCVLTRLSLRDMLDVLICILSAKKKQKVHSIGKVSYNSQNLYPDTRRLKGFSWNLDCNHALLFLSSLKCSQKIFPRVSERGAMVKFSLTHNKKKQTRHSYSFKIFLLLCCSKEFFLFVI